MSAFRNNLQKNDRVLDTKSGRQGKVARTPSNSGQRNTAVTFDGTTVARYLDVMQLRLIVNGRTPEDVPPCDGTPPPIEASQRGPHAGWPGVPSGLDALKDERARNAAEMAGMEQRFRQLKAANEKLDRAIAALTE